MHAHIHTHTHIHTCTRAHAHAHTHIYIHLYRDGLGKEIVSRFSTDFKTNSKFYTDANGRQMLERMYVEHVTISTLNLYQLLRAKLCYSGKNTILFAVNSLIGTP